ncbi:MAG: sulfurtransferase [Thiohalorhabdus sp.]|uniref:sulfurtransferase n=1 Tax=Thiohalorhabdus sp. TaxID=3094134 RepID=UPI0039807224
MLRTLIPAAGLLMAANLQAADVPGPLVDPDWVAEHRDEVAVIDVRGDDAAFTKGHIEGAALARWGAIRTEGEEDGVALRKMLPDADTFTELMRDWGVDKGEAVVITAPGTSPGHVAHSARLYWQVKYYGHNNVAVLDGGNAAWKEAGHDLQRGETDPEPGDFRVREERREILATTADVARAVEEDNAQLVDNRSLPYYLGLEQKSYVQAPGHIPGAKLLPFMYLAHGEEALTMRPAEELRDFAEAMGIDPDRPAITYCNSGNVCTVGWFVFQEILGNPDVRAYDGSMHAWTKDPEHPTTTMRME